MHFFVPVKLISGHLISFSNKSLKLSQIKETKVKKKSDLKGNLILSFFFFIGNKIVASSSATKAISTSDILFYSVLNSPFSSCISSSKMKSFFWISSIVFLQSVENFFHILLIYMRPRGAKKKISQTLLSPGMTFDKKKLLIHEINNINYTSKRRKTETNHVKTIKSMLSTAIQYNNFHGAIIFFFWLL